MEMTEVKATIIRIIALEEERDSYKKEAKRCQEDIDALYITMRNKVMAPTNQTALDLASGRA